MCPYSNSLSHGRCVFCGSLLLPPAICMAFSSQSYFLKDSEPGSALVAGAQDCLKTWPRLSRRETWALPGLVRKDANGLGSPDDTVLLGGHGGAAG